MRTPSGEPPRWRGINHLALVTPDMDATVRFFHGVLGMRLVASVMAGPMRHYFFELGPENTIAFFEVKEAGCEVTDVIDHGFVRSIYFTDPHGIALEASWWPIDTTGRPADYGDDRVFADPDPVPAVRELAERGELDWVPQTKLT